MAGKHPLSPGDRVVDKNGEFGTVCRTFETNNADGSLLKWSAVIRYSNGQTRSISTGDVSKILADGKRIDL